MSVQDEMIENDHVANLSGLPVVDDVLLVAGAGETGSLMLRRDIAARRAADGGKLLNNRHRRRVSVASHRWTTAPAVRASPTAFFSTTARARCNLK